MYAYWVAKLVFCMVATPDNHIVLLVKVVVVVTQVANRYHSFTVGLVNLGIDTVRLDAADMCIVGITNSVGLRFWSARYAA